MAALVASVGVPEMLSVQLLVQLNQRIFSEVELTDIWHKIQ